MVRTDVIAVDGSTHSQYAFDSGRAADVDAICAAVKKRNDEIGNLTDGYMNILRAKKVQAKLLTPSGDKPGELIVKTAKEQDASSIVMGTRGLGSIRRTFLGSVSEFVVHHSHCPVTVVREKQDC
ncbi:stress response protein nhax [Plakobranchus ocellatus]|uniref:Stress response protein nhax n=1 Tax=Plakobranchus ocellatus TaxID=259542 RepID=A0AAV3Z8S0_9GAST|nr:stress response protein nhax [Plakobranchus ocellatus]